MCDQVCIVGVVLRQSPPLCVSHLVHDNHVVGGCKCVIVDRVGQKYDLWPSKVIFLEVSLFCLSIHCLFLHK